MVTELGGEGYQAGVLARFRESVELMTSAGAEVVEVSCPHFVHALATYYLILPGRGVVQPGPLRRDALRPAGHPRRQSPSAEDVMRATREAGFGDEVKRRIILGTYALSSGYYDAYYGQAQKVRTLITRDFEAAFEQADVLVSPTAPTTAFKLGEKVDDPLAMYLNDLATIPANLSGVPGISVPSGLADEDGLPAGVQILAPALADDRVYRVGAALEALLAREWGGPLLDRRPELWTGVPRMTDALLSYDDVLAQFDPALGLEVHVELNTATKMFCGCPTEFGAEPNTQTCPTCLGLPGSMPVVNAKAVESAIRIGLALNCEIAEWCRFARKNYFYPDMPKNFQTSPVRRADRLRGLHGRRRRTGETVPGRDRARPHGGGHRQVAARRRQHRPDPRRRLLAGRLQPGRHPADRDRHQADPRHRRARRPRSRGRTSRSCATCCSASA